VRLALSEPELSRLSHQSQALLMRSSSLAQKQKKQTNCVSSVVVTGDVVDFGACCWFARISACTRRCVRPTTLPTGIAV
jgi:hypothetical protein